MFFLFFQAEDGIRDADVTGVQTCALPISAAPDAGIPRAGQVSGVSTWCRTDWKRGRHCSQIAGSGETAMPFYWRGAGGMLGAPPIPGMMRYVLSVLQCQ